MNNTILINNFQSNPSFFGYILIKLTINEWLEIISLFLVFDYLYLPLITNLTISIK